MKDVLNILDAWRKLGKAEKREALDQISRLAAPEPDSTPSSVTQAASAKQN